MLILIITGPTLTLSVESESGDKIAMIILVAKHTNTLYYIHYK